MPKMYVIPELVFVYELFDVSLNLGAWSVESRPLLNNRRSGFNAENRRVGPEVPDFQKRTGTIAFMRNSRNSEKSSLTQGLGTSHAIPLSCVSTHAESTTFFDRSQDMYLSTMYPQRRIAFHISESQGSQSFV